MRPSPREQARSRSSRPVTLALSLGVVLSLGVASRVWGGPPEEPPASDPAVEPVTDPANTGAALAPIGEPAPTDELPAVDESVSVPDAISLRTRMEEGMAEIGELAVEARNDADLVRATCVLDKQDRAADVMELGTGELLVIRDPTTPEQARTFAVEKLDAASGRIDTLVEEAKACAGEQGPEERIDITRNDADEPRTIPLWDPTAGLGNSPVPPPVDGGWPPAASPIE